jgi:hypothetical protein
MINDLLNKIDNKDIIQEGKYFYNGVAVPRVTQILSDMLHEEYLMKWANAIGFRYKKYETERERAAFIGSGVHNAIENYIKTKIYNEETLEGSRDVVTGINNGFSSFLLWWNTINENNTVEVLGMEQELICPYYGGTYDLLLKINGKVYLIDFKTSNHMSYKYWIQTASYRHMLFMNYGISIDGIILLQLDKKEVSYEEYFIDLSIKQHYDFIELCNQTFLSLVYAFYMRKNVELQYKTLF